jgi:hypothetical protein
VVCNACYGLRANLFVPDLCQLTTYRDESRVVFDDAFTRGKIACSNRMSAQSDFYLFLIVKEKLEQIQVADGTSFFSPCKRF